MIVSRVRLSMAAVAAVVGLVAAPAARADLSSLVASCQARFADAGNQFPYQFCDDGVPPSGGVVPNSAGTSAIKVPAKYDGYIGLPPKAPDAASMRGADSAGNIALDVDLSLPPATMTPPPGGFPILVLMHGCCGGSKRSWEASTTEGDNSEQWHDNNAWYASRGYVVITYTARGFVDNMNHGSTGETQLDSRRFEVNDYQYLAGVVADDSALHADGQKVVTIGGSYGGGFSWLTVTDPVWTSPGGKPMQLVASAPKYGWTDLVNSLVPNGRQSSDPAHLQNPTVSGANSLNPIGILKTSITGGLFGTGVNPTGNHTTFPPYIERTLACLSAGEPYSAATPQCLGVLGPGGILESFLADRSAYYQQYFFNRVPSDPAFRVPVFSAGTFYDPLFPTIEHARMANRLRATFPGYPLEEYYGDYEHLYALNKPKEWADICGADHHVCATNDPAPVIRVGVNTRINRFLDHYAAPPGDPSAPTPPFDTTASLRTCPVNADASHPADEPGDTFTASSLQALAPHRLNRTLTQVSPYVVNPQPNQHSVQADPVLAEQAKMECVQATGPAPPGAAVFETTLASAVQVLGIGKITIDYSSLAPDLELNARVYDVAPDGTASLIDRGAYRIHETPVLFTRSVTYELLGAAWPLPAGHKLRVEVIADDSPFLRADNIPSAATISRVGLSLPVR
jgi:ABC-2 type transport system ATP-binding protein